MVKRIGILTSGGDAPGMNAAIRAAIRVAINHNIEIYGIEDGYTGLVEGRIKKLTYHDASEILTRGGTILGSSRLPRFKKDEVQYQAIEQLNKFGIEALIVIGGDGSYQGALALTKKGVNCIGIPGTIDNDIRGTDKTIGFSTALNTICDAVNKLRDTSSSHHRCFIVEVMGNHCGNLALWSAITCGSEVLINRDTGYDDKKIVDLLNNHEDQRKKKHALIICSEKYINVQSLANIITKETNFSGRAITLGHIQRGGSPTPEDRLLGSQMGKKAVECLMRGEGGKCICVKGEKIIARDIEEALSDPSTVQPDMYDLFDNLI